MAIDSAEMIFFASQFANDETYGGGPMSGNVVQDGVSANVFPLIGEADAASGRLQMRKVYAAIVSANNDTLLNAAVDVWTPPTDADIDVLAFKFGDHKTTRSAAAAALAQFPFSIGTLGGSVSGTGTTRTVSNPSGLAVGDRVLFVTEQSNTILHSGIEIVFQKDVLTDYLVHCAPVVTAISGASVTFDFGPSTDTQPGSAGLSWYKPGASPSAPKVCGNAAITSAAAASDTEIVVSRVEGRLVPNLTPYPSAPNGINSAPLRITHGTVPIFRAGDLAVVRNAAGTTSELVLITGTHGLTLQLAAPLVNSYSTGFVTSLVALGDLRAEVGSSFSQQTWTRTFSDTIIGNPIASNYDRTAHPVVLTNEGAETERWAFVFTTATDFKLIGESLGQIASGSTATDFAPINPITNQPFFTIDSAGWGTGWQAGNVWRMNTLGARAPFWSTRCISPGTAASTDGAFFQFRGSY